MNDKLEALIKESLHAMNQPDAVKILNVRVPWSTVPPEIPIMVAELLQAGVCYVSGCEKFVTIFVGFNDLFHYASADGEDLFTTDIKPLYEAWKSDSKWGVVKWVSKRRNMRPLWSVAKEMIEDGAWDVPMEDLPIRNNGGWE